MHTIPLIDHTSLDQLLVQLQALYRQLIEQELSSRADYYQQRICIIEQARVRLYLDHDALYSIQDEFLPEYQIISQQVSHLLHNNRYREFAA